MPDLCEPEHPPGLDRITWLAARLLGASVAFISRLSDQQIMAAFSLKGDVSRHLLETAQSLIIPGQRAADINNLTLDPHTRDHPLATGPDAMRSYAAVAVTTPDGTHTGSLILLHQQTRPPLSPFDQDTLRGLADLAGEAINLHNGRLDLTLQQHRLQRTLALTQTISWVFHPSSQRFSLGGSAEDLGLTHIGMPDTIEDWARLIHPEDRERTVRQLHEAIDSRRAYAEDYRVVSATGEVTWLRAQGQPQLDAAGQVLCFVGCVQNITRQKRDEAALLESETRLRTVLETISEPIYLKDLNGRYRMFNPAALSFVKQDADQAYGAVDADLFPGQAERIHAMDQQVMLTRQPVTYEVPFPDRTTVMQTTKHPYIVNGELAGVLGISRDISAHRNLEEQLVRQARRTSSILESLPSAFIALDPAWRFVYINAVAARMFGRAPDEVLGQPVWPFLHRLTGLHLKDRLQAVPGTSTLQFEVHTPETGAWFEISAASHEDGMAISFVDITARKQLEDSLRNANEDLERRVTERTAELRTKAYQDVLTSLPSRRAFEEAFERATEQPQGFQLLLLDVDDLKTVNDLAGHAQGDHLLQCFASALQEVFGPHGQAYRQGGDEFAVLLQTGHFGPARLREMMHRVHRQVGLQGYPSLRASMGAVTFPQDASAPNDLLRLADRRMLRDKAAHRAVRTFQGPHQSETDTHLSAEMMWQALRATSALISTDGLIDRAGWQAFLQAAVTALPSAEAGSMYVREGSLFVMRAQVGYSEALIGVGHPAEGMGLWYGTEKNWALGEARVLRGSPAIRAAAHPIPQWPAGNADIALFDDLGGLDHIQASLCVPVMVSGQVVATINLDNLRSEQAFEPYELNIAEEFARQAAAIVASHDRRAREVNRTQELEVLAQANAALGLVQEPEELERILVQETKELLRTAHVAFARYDHRDMVLRLVSPSGVYEHFPYQVIPEGQGISWHAIHSGKVLHVERLDQDPRVHTPGALPDGTLLAAPLIRTADVPIGVILAVRPASQSFSPLDGRLLGALASAGVTAFERLRVTVEEQRRTEELRMLAELARHVGLADDVGTIARECLSVCKTFLEADLALFTCPERGLEITVGEGAEDFLKAAARLLDGSAGMPPFTGEQGRATSCYPELPGALPEMVSAGVHGVVEVPVMERGRRIGKVFLVWLRPLEALPRTAEALMNRSAELIGQVLNREAHLADIEATREGALMALGLSLELRDFETAGHTERVVVLAVQVGQALGLTAEQLDDLRVGAYLHDIGKLAIPDDILLKPGKLNAAQRQLMQRHTVVGDELMSRIPTVLPGARAVIRHHHERWDGTGYPDQLAGDMIPLAARIFTVVDVFDALTRSRPYKHAWTVDAAIEELRLQAGRRFDPHVVEAALLVLAQQRS
ncbi:HD domain-containing phosphohydrolase [Deinococcus deserti]|nr:HD domain-containing phosphohydrolase [Deinococcus deserti]